MKKILLFFLLLSPLPLMLSAQTPPEQIYFRTGDTIHGRSPIYHYQWWSETWLSDTNNRLMLDRGDKICSRYGTYSTLYIPDLVSFKGEVMRYCYTEQPLKIVGIASALFVTYSLLQNSRAHAYPNARLDMPPFNTEYLRIYEADASENAYPLVGEIEWDYARAPRYMDVDVRARYRYYINRYNRTCCHEPVNYTSEIIPVKEFYFDKDITVYDSFYVGHTQYSNYYWTLENITNPLGLLAAYSSYLGATKIQLDDDCTDNSCECTPMHKYRFRRDYVDTSLYIDTLWRWFESPFFMLDFPIVLIDSSFFDGEPQYECPSVQNFRVGSVSNDDAVLLWTTHGDHVGWEVSYGPAGTLPGEGTVVTCPIQVAHLTGLDSCTHYVAYVRALCEQDTVLYSRWSEGVDIYSCDTVTSISVEPAGVLDQLTYVLPNPASDYVQVLSSFTLSRVEVYSLQGTKMLDVKATGVSSSFSVRGWPKGVYVVITHTVGGNAAKKLVVN